MHRFGRMAADESLLSPQRRSLVRGPSWAYFARLGICISSASASCNSIISASSGCRQKLAREDRELTIEVVNGRQLRDPVPCNSSLQEISPSSAQPRRIQTNWYNAKSQESSERNSTVDSDIVVSQDVPAHSCRTLPFSLETASFCPVFSRPFAIDMMCTTS
ncbi:hypothetical protein BKA63DRAFT_494229 [Paraphoma chrysanthemicola]|nr:hypothetical protein BKA63DRAFT_494229 [Paraphoma chrysanthemicola]